VGPTIYLQIWSTPSNASKALDLAFGFIEKDAVYRVVPVGVFVGEPMIAEYITVFASPGGPSNIIRPMGSRTRSFMAQAGFGAFAVVDYTFRNVLNNRVANMTIWQTFKFNKYNMIIAADFTTVRYYELMQELQTNDILAQQPQLAASLLITPLCKTAMQYCNGTLQQYANQTACERFMASIPLLDLQAVGSNNVACRFVHSVLLPTAPQIHCPHVGPTGGGACTNTPYADYYKQLPENLFMGFKGTV